MPRVPLSMHGLLHASAQRLWMPPRGCSGNDVKATCGAPDYGYRRMPYLSVEAAAQEGPGEFHMAVAL